tara:strand:- start:8 stop:268 length:261 start_codon:yes stop_codon:yes gene_type:complete
MVKLIAGDTTLVAMARRDVACSALGVSGHENLDHGLQDVAIGGRKPRELVTNLRPQRCGVEFRPSDLGRRRQVIVETAARVLTALF